eukprot:6321179-Karenia_brevis.AAC.2
MCESHSICRIPVDTHGTRKRDSGAFSGSVDISLLSLDALARNQCQPLLRPHNRFQYHHRLALT